MKKHFPGHFPPKKSELELLWKKCIFVVDTNILLNLYRYSDVTRKEFLRILDNIKERLWLPHRAAEEYFEKRLTVVSGQEKSYNDTLKAINTLENNFKNTRQHPFIPENLMKRLTEIFDDVSKELEKNKETLSKRLREDEIQEELRKIFDKRVGDPFTEEEIEAICKDGETRYQKKIPPGYKDAEKTEEESAGIGHRKFGDLIIWHQILNMSSEQKKKLYWLLTIRKKIGGIKILKERLWGQGRS